MNKGETPSALYDSQTIVINTKNAGIVPHENVFSDCIDKLNRLSQMEIENEVEENTVKKKKVTLNTKRESIGSGGSIDAMNDIQLGVVDSVS